MSPLRMTLSLSKAYWIPRLMGSFTYKPFLDYATGMGATLYEKKDYPLGSA